MFALGKAMRPFSRSSLSSHRSSPSPIGHGGALLSFDGGRAPFDHDVRVGIAGFRGGQSPATFSSCRLFSHAAPSPSKLSIASACSQSSDPIINALHKTIEAAEADDEPFDRALPALSDDKTWRTHPSVHTIQRSNFELTDREGATYQNLEFLGDKLIGLRIALLIDEHYPRLTVGARTHILGALVSNEVLGHLSRAYKLPDRLFAASAQAALLGANPGVQADLLEAYIGQVAKSVGSTSVDDLIRQLFVEKMSLLQTAYEAAREKFGDGISAESAEVKPSSPPSSVAGGEIASNNEDGSPDPYRANVDYVSLLLTNWATEKGCRWRMARFGEAYPEGPWGHWKASVIFYDGGREGFEELRVTWGQGQGKKAAQRQAAYNALIELGLLSTSQ